MGVVEVEEELDCMGKRAVERVDLEKEEEMKWQRRRFSEGAAGWSSSSP